MATTSTAMLDQYHINRQLSTAHQLRPTSMTQVMTDAEGDSALSFTLRANRLLDLPAFGPLGLRR